VGVRESQHTVLARQEAVASNGLFGTCIYRDALDLSVQRKGRSVHEIPEVPDPVESYQVAVVRARGPFVAAAAQHYQIIVIECHAGVVPRGFLDLQGSGSGLHFSFLLAFPGPGAEAVGWRTLGAAAHLP
jgi:hypothetical protein